jgi:thymidylate kinase
MNTTQTSSDVNLVSQREELSPQSLTQVLIDRFNREGITYCHWKSNIDLARTFKGELDIDLLVSNNSLPRATEILLQLGFKQAVTRWEQTPTGIFHYYGFDPHQKDLVHLHMFTRVLTGESFLKSHLLPFEEMLLENSYSAHGLTVTSKEAELVLFVLRTYIKYGSFLDVLRVLKSDKKVREEARWLKDNSDMARVSTLLDKYCPVVDEDTFIEGLNAILNGAPYLNKWIFSRRVRRQLRVYRKYSFAGWLSGHVRLLTGKLVKKIRKQKGSKILASGGTIIAIIGADATGKSTLVRETSRWLRKNLVVNTVHAGKPPSALLTLPVNILLALYRKFKRVPQPARGIEKDALTEAGEWSVGGAGLGSLIYAARAVCLAWDRRTLLLKVRRASANGEIVVCDRYPTNAPGMMDSPRLLENAHLKGWRGKIYARLSRWERDIYRQIPHPDIVLRLRVSLEIAKKRNAERETVDDEIYLENRHQQVEDWSVAGARVIKDINTDPPLAKVVATVKQSIWSFL